MQAGSVGSVDDPKLEAAIRFYRISFVTNILYQVQPHEASGLAGTMKTSWSSITWIPLCNIPT